MSAVAIRDLGLRDAEDKEIFKARQDKAVVMTKDSDFVLLLDKLGAPPQVNLAHLRKNTSNARLKEVVTNTLPKAIDLLNFGEKLVEINAA